MPIAQGEKEPHRHLETCYITFFVAEGQAECALLYRDVDYVIATFKREHKNYDTLNDFRNTLGSLYLSYKMRLLPC